MAAPMMFPYEILKANSFRLDLIGSTVVGGLSQSGQQQRVNATGGGLWGVQLEFNTLRTPQQVRAWRSIQYGSQGGVVPINLSICESSSPRKYITKLTRLKHSYLTSNV